MKARILFIKSMTSTFINQDEELLKKHYQVEVFEYKPGNVWRMLLSQIQLTWWLIFHLFKADLVFVWFADYHALIPVLLSKIYGKKSIVQIAGMDGVKLPEVNHGVYLRPFRGLCVKIALRFCDLVLLPDASLIECVNTYCCAAPLKAGIKNLVPHFRTPTRVIPFGFDDKKWNAGDRPKENLVVTVAIAATLNRMKLKGIDTLLEVAKNLPESSFLIIGATGDVQNYLEKNRPDNLTIIGPVPNEDLLAYYQRAKVYAQFSLSEGLPNAICEAMLCECVAVGSNVNGIPTAIADTGFIIHHRDIGEATQATKNGLEAHKRLRKLARKRIQEHFSLQQREQQLIQAVDEVVSK